MHGFLPTDFARYMDGRLEYPVQVALWQAATGTLRIKMVFPLSRHAQLYIWRGTKSSPPTSTPTKSPTSSSTPPPHFFVGTVFTFTQNVYTWMRGIRRLNGSLSRTVGLVLVCSWRWCWSRCSFASLVGDCCCYCFDIVVLVLAPISSLVL